MGAKKGKKGKGKGAEDEENPTENFLAQYRKAAKLYETPPSKFLLGKVEETLDEGEELQEILVNEKIGEFGARALFTALTKSTKDDKGFPTLRCIRLWECDIGDEGARALQKFVIDTNNTSLALIELLNCNIGPLGCEFISRCFDSRLPSTIQTLTLDYNLFGNDGVNNLLMHLTGNTTLTTMSLNYCGIDHLGIKAFVPYLESNKTLEKLLLMGNPLKDDGVQTITEAIARNEALEEINLNNTSFGEKKETIDQIIFLITNSQNMLIYHCKFNLIKEEYIKEITKALQTENGKHVYQFNIDEKYTKETFDAYFKTMKGRKLKKKKKAKKKKKK